MSKHLILIHGLFHSPWFMRQLNAYYQNNGYQVHLLQYATLHDEMHHHMQRLEQIVQTIPTKAHIDFVGHSMGGLIIRQYASLRPERFTGRVVTLGTPHQGSFVAAWAQQYMPWLMGKSFSSALNGNVPQWENTCELGSLAGNKKNEIGYFILPNQPHDGLVLVSETIVQNATDHIILPIHHNGMRHDLSTMQQSLHFLNHGKFKKTTPVK